MNDNQEIDFQKLDESSEIYPKKKVLVVVIMIFFALVVGMVFFLKSGDSKEQVNISSNSDNQKKDSFREIPPGTPSSQKIDNQKEVNNLEDRLIEKYRLSNESRKKIAVDYSVVALGGNYDSIEEYDKPISIEVRKMNEKVGSFQGSNDMTYVPVHVKGSKLFLAAYCSGVGGICRGNLMEFDLSTGKISKIAENALDFFMTDKGRYLIMSVVNNDWESFGVELYDFENSQLIKQSIALRCSSMTNVKKECGDLLLQKDGEIIFLPINYNDVKLGEAYKLTVSRNSAAAKSSIKNDELESYETIFPISKQ